MTISKLHIRPYQADDEEQVITLWRSCNLVRPGNDPQKEIRRKAAFQPELFLVGLHTGQIVSTVMAGYEGRRGWLNYVAVTPGYQRQGIGRAMVEVAITILEDKGCPKVNLQIVASNRSVVDFYQSIGFVIEDLVSMGRRL